MTIRHLCAAVTFAALMTAPALAQTTAPTTPAPAAPAATAPAPAATPAPHMTEQKAGQWLASKMPGVDVYNSADEKIGDIADLIIDKDGKIDAAVISVGGFLGMGKHDVAVPLSEIKWVETAPAAPRPTTPANPMAPASSSSSTTTTEPATTGTVSASDAVRAYPYRAVVNMTADQLKAAPAFKYAR